MLRISRRLEYAERFGRQQADQAIKRNVVRALVELITNSDDSYNRLEETGHSVAGRIIVDVLRRQKGSEIRVTDFAEGMDEAALDRGLGVYGEDASGFSSGAPVRGYFGRGLKDAILGMGDGEVISIQNEKVHKARLVTRSGIAHYEGENSRPVSAQERAALGALSGDCTRVHITITREDVRMPQFDTLRRQLSFYYSLRNILSSSKRQLLLREIGTRGNARTELQLSYKMPKGLQLLSNTSKEFQFDNTTVSFRFVIYRSEVELNTPGEEGPEAQGGFLICGNNAIYDNTLLKFEGNEATRRYLGRVTCPYLDQLLRANEPVLKATRDGLDWEHAFNKALKRETESLVEPFIRREERASHERERKARSAKLQRKLDNVIQKLNEIAKQELEVPGQGSPPPKQPFVPESGFGFVPEFSQVVSGKEGTLLLRALSNLVPQGNIVKVSSDNPEVMVLTPQISLEERQDFPWLVEAKVRIEGGQVNNEGILAAETDGLKADALVVVVARRERNGNGPPPPPRGLFNKPVFDDGSDPPQRVKFDRSTGNIIVYTNAPSVKPYVSVETSEMDDTPQGQVLLAELVLEASCSEIIRRKIVDGSITLLDGTEADTLENEYRKFRQKHASLIHEVLVDREFRR